MKSLETSHFVLLLQFVEQYFVIDCIECLCLVHEDSTYIWVVIQFRNNLFTQLGYDKTRGGNSQKPNCIGTKTLCLFQNSTSLLSIIISMILLKAGSIEMGQ